MRRSQDSYREAQYRPQAAKTLRQTLIRFIQREFPRLGGPWVIDLFVDKLLELVDIYRIAQNRLKPGQTVWQAVAVDERPRYRKPMTETRQVPVVITIADQEEVEDLRNRVKRREILQRGLVRAANDAYAQGGVLTVTDLALLFNHSASWVSELIRTYETETGEVVPRRGNIHDMGRTITHKWIICRKAYLEGKLTPTVARETFHSPEAVDHYTLDLARVHFATVRQGMTPQETAFALQRPLYIVEEYVKMIEAFGLGEKEVYDRVGAQLAKCSEEVEALPVDGVIQTEEREQEPIAA
ncbi:MAG: DUF1670 domain-containing protein [Anaerolineales bacterium]|nr:MAG: DUF1670 domain-containing protein [Anaerolineales bacterium]